MESTGPETVLAELTDNTLTLTLGSESSEVVVGEQFHLALV